MTCFILSIKNIINELTCADLQSSDYEVSSETPKKANFPNVSIAFEPTAAAVAVAEPNDSEEVIAVYDFGGGTFDVSIIKKHANGVYIPLEKGQGDYKYYKKIIIGGKIIWKMNSKSAK